MSIKESLTNIPLIKFERSDIIRVAYERTTIYSAATLSTNIVGYNVSGDDDIQYGQPYNIQLTPKTGYQALPWNTKVLMAGVDITDTSYDKATGAISISSVTGDITIEAEAVMMPSEYEPVEYIRNVITAAAQVFDLGFKGTENTRILIDAYYGGGTNLLYRMNGASSNPAPRLNLRYISSGIYFGWGNYNERTTDNYVNNRGVFEINRNVYKYNGNVKETVAAEGVTFTCASNISLWGANQSSNNPNGMIYRCKAWEVDVPMRDYLPCKRVSDGFVGLYDTINATAMIKDDDVYIAPNVLTIRHYTGCTASRLSAAITGTAAYAVIGSTWSIKITPSSGYTFVGGTTPQVMIDGVDVTSQVVSDNGDGTYNVAIANVEDKPIEITAMAVSDGTANATNSVTPMGGNTENNEEEM